MSASCDRCGAAAGRPNFGIEALCPSCLEAARAPIRGRVMARQGDVDRWPPPGLDGTARIVGRLRREYGAGVYDVECSECGATWAGAPGDRCGWCRRSLELLVDMHRRVLLCPDWMADDHGPRYDELSNVDKAVWDRTRGQTSGSGSRVAWAERLARGVLAGLITEAEAKAALDRATQHG